MHNSPWLGGLCSQPCLAALAYTNRVYSEMTERSRCTLQSMSNTRIPTPKDRTFPPKQLSTSLLSQLGHPSCVEKKFLNSGSSSNLLHRCPASLYLRSPLEGHDVCSGQSSQQQTIETIASDAGAYQQRALGV